ncbi:RusA family crossover junction endodeoxyribonuclease [Clostridium tagluense]|uniref:RusA family crossover junction endodeoxyribonuclease n=1 Tax=Clostridium TaxID=1485 RepID=UPI0013E94D3C|nr:MULTISPECIES: RusA family crossover junction endodeoxyribonuclease [Clostridium]MBU3127292.1 RusA family crossover junction endodeoxyribonuclease [Clostridium tagluense]MBW9155413.1 RusA family crossover junction endodeoxyribonuclease [Clostridium tagluense]MBZ9621723.1 RusA family crossover junction endodeoxyribonuclease [Clostridium sp. FP2]MCB2311234.1 RusA family crossover junction endodeoxyribonuclease [Clostridium tagluense]MCB2315958.1 RusA family crossover junction endodeoxyribonucl
MSNTYAKVIIKGSPISKSNFKLFNMNGRAILPYNSGKYHDRYALYEEEIAYQCRIQNSNIFLTESLIAVLKVYYKSIKRHPDTNNITKSIFDGIEKSGLIVNDAQVTRLIIEEFYDTENPRFELELFGESTYAMNYSIVEKKEKKQPINYDPPSNKKKIIGSKANKSSSVVVNSCSSKLICEICGKSVLKDNCISANKGKTSLCKTCFKKLF